MATHEQTVLFGLLAVQLGKVKVEDWELAAAKTLQQAADADKTVDTSPQLDIGKHLVAAGTISPHDAATIQGMAAEAIRANQGDVLKAINALASASDIVHTIASSLFEDPHAAATLVHNAGFDPSARTIALSGAPAADPQTIATGSSYAETLATDPSFADTIASQTGGDLSHAATIASPNRPPGAAPTILGAGAPGEKHRQRSPSDSLPAVPEHEGRYEFVKALSQGGMGQLVIVHDSHLGRDVALKTLLPDRVPGGTRNRTRTGAPTMEILTVPIIARFLQEARIAGQLEHPGIVPAYELGYRADGTIYYTMRLVHGRALQDMLKDCKTLEERLKLLPNFLEVCNAIAFAHSRGVIHRDLKPLNVMIGEFGVTQTIDWGISKIKGVTDIHAGDVVERARVLRMGDTQGSTKTMEGQAMGSPYFMPPEQAAGKIDEVDERADIYSLGAILYVYLTGHPPYKEMKVMEFLDKVQSFAPRPIKEQEPEAPAELIAICERAMARKREDRYQTATALRDEVEKFISGGLVGAYKYSMKELVKRWVKKHKKILSTAAAGLIAFLVLAVYSYIAVTIQRNEAVAQRIRAEENEQLAQTELYFANTSLAQRSIESAQMASARKQLEEAPAKDRNWEWGHFQQLANQDKMTLEIGGQYVALGPNNTLITGNDRGTISIVDAKTGESKARLIEKAGYEYAFTTSADGKRAAMNGPAGVHVWDVESQKELFKIEHADSGGKRIAFGVSLSADGARVAANQPDDMARVWDTATGAAVYEAPAPLGGIYLNPAGAWAAVTRLDREASAFMADIVDLAANTKLKTFAFGMDNAVKDVVFSADGRHVAFASNQALVLYETAGWTIPVGGGLPIDGPFGKVDTVAFSADGKYLAAATQIGQVFRVKLEGDYEGFYARTPHNSDVRSIAIAGAAGLLATASSDRTIHLYDLDSLELISSYAGHDAALFDVAVDDGGTVMASAAFDGLTKVWGLDASLDRHFFPPAGERPAVFAQDKGQIAIATAKGVVIADAATQRTLRSLSAPNAGLLAWDAAGTRLAAFQPLSAAASKVSVFDTAGDGAELLALNIVGAVQEIGVSGDGSLLVVESDEGLQVYPVAGGGPKAIDGAMKWALAPRGALIATCAAAADGKGARVSVLQGAALEEQGSFDTAALPNLLWNSDGTKLFAGTQRPDGEYTKGVLMRWDVAAKAALPPLEGHGQTITAATDNANYVITGADKGIIVWDAATGLEKFTLRGHASTITALALSPDGTRLVSGSQDGTFMLWGADDGRAIATIQSTGLTSGVTLDTIGWQTAFTPDGATIATISNPPMPPVALHAYPWDEAKFGPPIEGKPLQARIEQYKRGLARVVACQRAPRTASFLSVARLLCRCRLHGRLFRRKGGQRHHVHHDDHHHHRDTEKLRVGAVPHRVPNVRQYTLRQHQSRPQRARPRVQLRREEQRRHQDQDVVVIRRRHEKKGNHDAIAKRLVILQLPHEANRDGQHPQLYRVVPVDPGLILLRQAAAPAIRQQPHVLEAHPPRRNVVVVVADLRDELPPVLRPRV
jgi:serine/threonine protein kinase/WD40 repeat protein